MNDSLQSSALTPNPSHAGAGEGSVVSEMAVNHFRKLSNALRPQSINGD
jgi:hypothetical protein